MIIVILCSLADSLDAGEGGGTAAGGVLLDASQGQYLESLSLKRVLIFRFTAGTGLMLHAGNGGAVTYSVQHFTTADNATSHSPL